MAPNCWPRLPRDVLNDILCRLSVADYIRSGAVCSSWRQATANKNPRRNPKSPLLMFPSRSDEDSDDPDSFRFFSIADCRHRRFNLPQIRGKQCAGSFHGSIIAAGPTEILLLDPFTNATIRLPPAPVYNEEDVEEEVLVHVVEKVVFSPSASVAVTIHSEGDVLGPKTHLLSFARVGDNSWSWLDEGIFYSFCDVTLHRGEFFVLDSTGTLLFLDPADGRCMRPRGYGSHILVGDGKTRIGRRYLVESIDGDHLLMVCRMMSEESWMTHSFVVFKWDKAGLRWVEVASLGEVAIFVGSNYSVCIFTRGLPELRGNCVYFTEDRTLEPAHPTRNDFGVFSLEDGSIDQLVSLQQSRRSVPPPFWIMPSSS